MRARARTSRGAALALAAYLFLAPSSAAQDSAFAACVQDLAARDLAGKTAFQEAVRDLIVAHRPDFEPLASLHMSHQIALARARAAKMAHLLAHDPERIDTGSLAKFRNFDWTPADEAALVEEDPAAERLLARAAALGRKNDGHPDWPRLREFVRAELSPDPAFRALMAELAQNDRAVRKGLRNCRRQ
jgi:hypothetical protein